MAKKRDKKQNPYPPGFRPPGDRRPLSADMPREKKVFSLRRPGGIRPGAQAEAPAPSPSATFAPAPKPKTDHDLYLTYDARGKLRTHTVYHAPPSNKPIVPIVGKKKPKIKPQESSAPSEK